VVASNSGQTTTIDLRVLIDLSPLQTNSQGLLNVPDDNCRNYSASNFVLSIAEASLNADGNRLTLNASGKFDRWACVENPVPGTKVEWQIKDVGLGIKTKIPVVVTSPGSPIKTVLGSGNFALSRRLI
jgi:hypothetical protein